MQRHFERELEGLKTTIVKMGSLVEEAIGTAIRAVLNNDRTLADAIIAGDERINSLEIEVDNAIIDLLALQQPVATDLRLILAAQKVNNDLERIGDHAVNIAESAIALSNFGGASDFLELPGMASIAQEMLRNVLDAFIHGDVRLSKAVLTQDDAIDELNRAMARQVVTIMKADAAAIDPGLELIRISKNLERVADLATNIAEEVIFIAEAKVVKHHFEDRGVS